MEITRYPLPTNSKHYSVLEVFLGMSCAVAWALIAVEDWPWSNRVLKKGLTFSQESKLVSYDISMR